jgi:CDP-diglyceride synthetase
MFKKIWKLTVAGILGGILGSSFGCVYGIRWAERHLAETGFDGGNAPGCYLILGFPIGVVFGALLFKILEGRFRRKP